jgi:predicted nucleic acid-binding Zn finger protein
LLISSPAIGENSVTGLTCAPANAQVPAQFRAYKGNTMKTIEIAIYEYGELSDEAKENAVNQLSDLNVDYGWWEDIFEDTKRIHMTITAFDTGRSNYLDANFARCAVSVAEAIVSGHGDCCETHNVAKAFLADPDADIDEFYREIRGEYLDILRKEYEYKTSKEAIVESIEANEYHFSVNGNLA